MRRDTIKVLRVIARLNVGGPARHVITLSEGLASRGYDTLLAYGSVSDDEASLERLVSDRGIRAVNVGGLGRAIKPWDDARAWGALVRLMFREQPDVIHTHTAKAGILGRSAAFVFNASRRRQHRAVVVHTFHGHVLDGYFSPIGNVLVRAAERIASTVTDRIVAISPSQRDELVSRFRVAPAARTAVVPLGLELSVLAERAEGNPGLRQELGIGQRDPVIGYVGRFVPIKDLPTLIEAMSRVLREEPTAWLVMAGDGVDRSAIEAQARRLGVHDRMRLLGWRDDLAAVYGTIDICALSSRNEGTPVALIEAMAASRAVVATRVGGVPDVISPEQTGLLVPAGDPAAMATAILRLIRSPDLRRSLAKAAATDVLARYSDRRLLDDIDRLYRRALAEKRGAPGSNDDHV